MTFNDIEPQKIIDQLCFEYRRLDEHLEHPKHGLPNSIYLYCYAEDEKQIFPLTKFFRNIGGLERIEAFIDRLDSLWIAVEYFQDNIAVMRKDGGAFQKEMLEKYFICSMVDSLRSSLDILSGAIAYFFDLAGKNSMGFNYKKLIDPLAKKNGRLSDTCNSLYGSDDYAAIKKLRDAEKHAGLEKNVISIDELSKSIHMQRPTLVSRALFESPICKTLTNLLNIPHVLAEELLNHSLGYTSPNDKIAILCEDGRFFIPK
ncbi:MAG: Cthe_2314 family HEPN domain-containing protein [candidate division Zixibacteria bacterium]|nr:Cthe_2314 family HEPN domain-containing protein [candidate division Zixibacteria bacterium]